MEPWLTELPSVGEPATHALFIDPDPPDADQYSRPYGVVVLFADGADEVLTEFRELYDCPPEVDTRPDYDPYGI
jgi:hypothetical protein